mmetsp:Transcript_34141/g.62869  ORF Transcript_34141/g.62869 Transcript_34141/m.62869 type:complete len:797 (+) Transcript_34141:240-2630(+)
MKKAPPNISSRPQRAATQASASAQRNESNSPPAAPTAGSVDDDDGPELDDDDGPPVFGAHHEESESIMKKNSKEKVELTEDEEVPMPDDYAAMLREDDMDDDKRNTKKKPQLKRESNVPMSADAAAVAVAASLHGRGEATMHPANWGQRSSTAVPQVSTTSSHPSPALQRENDQRRSQRSVRSQRQQPPAEVVTASPPPPQSMVSPLNDEENPPSLLALEATTIPLRQRVMQVTANDQSSTTIPAFHEVEATLVPNEPVYDAVPVRPTITLTWWERYRMFILVGVISLIFGAMAATIGVVMGGQSDENGNNDPSSGVQGGAGVEPPTLSPMSLASAQPPSQFYVFIPTSNGVNSTSNGVESLILSPTSLASAQPTSQSSSTTPSSDLSLSSTTPPTPTPLIWNQVGNSIFGDSSYDYFGYSTSLSADGNTLAVGAYGNNHNGDNSGQVKIYRRGYSGSSWEQVGDSISGDAAGDGLGTVSLSQDGKTLAIGGEQYDNDGPGYVKVYKLDEGSLQFELLQTVTGESGDDYFGYDLALNFDGRTLAIGAHQYDMGAGYVKVFQWDQGSSNYVQLQTIDGDSYGDEFGSFLDLSSDGSTLAIGALYNDANGVGSGQVKVYVLDGSASNYKQRGKTLAGDAPGDNFGSSLALSSDGLILAVGAEGNDFNGSNSGQVKVYRWNEESSEYRQRGKLIYGAAADDYLGQFSLSLSSDGKILVAGAFKNDANGDDAGQVNVYEWDESTSEYVQLGQSLSGDAPGDEFGRSVALSLDGSTLAVGAQLNDIGLSSGQVKVFTIERF